jgi:uncharacterized protein (UPF0276 family)
MMTETSTIKPNPAFHGFGLGLRAQHYPDFLETSVPVDFVEVISENFMIAGGRPPDILDRVRERYPVALHGVSMSIGSADGLSVDHLTRLKKLVDHIQPLFVSDHLCWTRIDGFNSHDLLPLPYTQEAMDVVCANISHAQDVLGRAMLIENPSSYIAFEKADATEWQFLAEMCARTGCDLLLDVNNIFVSATNHGFDALEYISGVPVDRVRQIHLAGHSQGKDMLIDTHDRPVSSSVWALYEAAIARDDDIPPLAELLAELDTARIRCGPTSHRGMSLLALQRDFRDHLVDAATPADGGLAIYHNAYRVQLTDCLAETFAKTLAWLGGEAFVEAARDHIESTPPHGWTLGDYGNGFDATLASRHPDDPEVAELARIEWMLSRAFEDEDTAALPADAIAKIDWERATLAFVPSLRTLSALTNAGAILSALATTEQPPATEMLPQPATTIVWRQDFTPCFRTIETIEHEAIMTMAAGASFATLCATLVDAHGEAEGLSLAGTMLGQWFADGLVCHANRREILCA